MAAAEPQPPVLAFSPAPFDYGQVAPGRTASQTFTLANTGRKATGKLQVRLSGSAAFTITGNTCKSLAPAKTCTVTIRFTPADPGTVTATLTAADTKRQVTATVALTGAAGLGAAPGHLYWSNRDQATIKAIPLAGLNPQLLPADFGQRIEFCPTVIFRRFPLRTDPAFLFKLMQSRVERTIAHLQDTIGDMAEPATNCEAV